MSTEAVFEGGCLCGAVRYRAAAAPIGVTHCHCKSCRRAVGAALVTWATFASADVAFTLGAPAWFRSSERAERGFCHRCGTSLAYRNDDHPEEIDLTVGSLDAPERVRPTDHIWAGDKIGWLNIDDDLLQLEQDHWQEGWPER